MALNYSGLQEEVLRRATRNQSGGVYDDAAKNIINSSLFRVAREAKWRQLRREGQFETVAAYTTGSGGGTFTNDSKNVTIVGATFLTDNVQPGRLIKLQGDSYVNTIATITGETTLTLERAYAGTTVAGTGTYSIYPQEEYNLPIQSTHRCFLWHEQYGYPFLMEFTTDQTFIGSGITRDNGNIPTHYRMWGEDMVRNQVKSASTLAIASSDTNDTSIDVTIFGTVSGYPDYETITTNGTNGTTSVAGTKSFSEVERVVKTSNTVGRITVTADSGNTTVAVLTAGNITPGIMYSKVRLYPLPSDVFPINVWFYKDPYRLVNNNDVHELGQDFDEAIILLSVARINYENNKQAGDKFMLMYKDEIRSLKKKNIDKIDFLRTLRRGMRVGHRGYPHRYLSPQQVGPHFGSRVLW